MYRYPHPLDATKFIYCGQGPKRDAAHRRGEKGFGRRFKRDFPGIELPQPIRETVEVADRLELNELETVWMFRYHTWRGYEGGMNLTFPGCLDYKNFNQGLTSEKRAEIGRKNGPKAVQTHKVKKTGLCAPGSPMQIEGGKVSGRINGPRLKKEKRGIFAPGMQAAGGATSAPGNNAKHKANGTGIFAPGVRSLGGKKANHNRYHANRNVIKEGCMFCAAA